MNASKQGDILGASIFSSTYVANGALTRKEVSAMWAVKLKYHFRIKFALQLEILLRNDNPEYVASLEEKLMLAEKNFNIVAGGAIKTAPTGEALFTRRQVLEISILQLMSSLNWSGVHLPTSMVLTIS